MNRLLPRESAAMTLTTRRDGVRWVCAGPIACAVVVRAAGGMPRLPAARWIAGLWSPTGLKLAEEPGGELGAAGGELRGKSNRGGRFCPVESFCPAGA